MPDRLQEIQKSIKAIETGLGIPGGSTGATEETLLLLLDETRLLNSRLINPEIAFSYGDPTPWQLARVASGKTVLTVTVGILTPFNGTTPSLTIGDSGDPARFMSLDLSTASGTYEVNPDYLYSTETDINLYLSIGGSTTAGNGIILINLSK
jgi:hypothetical protein